MMNNYYITVIVPIYNVAQYISRCVESLMQQTLCQVEYIFVDDCSPDNSIAVLHSVLEKYPDRLAHTKVIKHNLNRGVSAARNSGISAATGEYIFFCDSDDYLEPTMLELLYRQAVAQQADYVWCDYFIARGKETTAITQPSSSTRDIAIRQMLTFELSYNVWNKIVKRAIFTKHNITFAEGQTMGEDLVMIQLLAYANRVANVQIPLYYYVQDNGTSATKHYTLRHCKSLHFTVCETVSAIRDLFPNKFELELSSLQIQSKWPLLIQRDKAIYHEWERYYPEAHAYIWKYNNKDANFRIKLIEWFAAKGQYWVVWLHYQIVIRFYTNWLRKP